MRNIKKYSAMAILGAGLALAAASPASACGGFGMVGFPVFGAAFGGCGGPFGFAAPVAFGWGGGCAPVAFGCGYGGYGMAYHRRAYGAAYGACGCGGYGRAGYGYGYAHRGGYGGYGMAYHRQGYGHGYAYHRPYGYGMASYRHHRPYAFAARHHRTYSYAAYSPRPHARSYAFTHGARYSSIHGKHHIYAMRQPHRLASRTLSRWG
jgi:hypothetical protein